MTRLSEPMQELFTRSRLLVLNFDNIPKDTEDFENIAKYFKSKEKLDQNPRLPENRQAFNDTVLDKTAYRYLVSQYGEDRQSMLKGSSIELEGRTIHLGIDVFSKGLESVMSPCDGTIVQTGREDENHSFGNYLIIRPADGSLPLFFFGHLSNRLPKLGEVAQGQNIAWLGDYKSNENGGWSRHLHLQCLANLPPEGQAPIGYGLSSNVDELNNIYPNPLKFFANWTVR